MKPIIVATLLYIIITIIHLFVPYSDLSITNIYGNTSLDLVVTDKIKDTDY